MNLLPSTEPREPEARRMTSAELRTRIMTLAVQIKETKNVKEIVSRIIPACGTKEWLISALDNRVVKLTADVTAVANALAGISEVADVG